MNQIEKAIRDLSSPNKNTRYDACEELRIADSLPDDAIIALEKITNDPDILVADAAKRALAIHRTPSLPGGVTQAKVFGREKTIGVQLIILPLFLICGAIFFGVFSYELGVSAIGEDALFVFVPVGIILGVVIGSLVWLPLRYTWLSRRDEERGKQHPG